MKIMNLCNTMSARRIASLRNRDGEMAEQSYKWDAADYAEQSAGQQKWAEELLAKLNLSGSEHILDIGCGDGKVSCSLAQNVPQGKVVAIDLSEDMIALAQTYYSDIENISFQQSSATDFVYAESFDAIFSNAALHWVHDHITVLSNCHQSLRKGGEILFQMGGKGNAVEFITQINHVMSLEKWKSYFIGFSFPFSFNSIESYAQWLKQTGFQARRIELIDKDIQHKGKDGLAGYFRTAWLPYTTAVPENKREEFINYVVERYLEKYPVDSMGNTHVNMVRLEVEAVKV